MPMTIIVMIVQMVVIVLCLGKFWGDFEPKLQPGQHFWLVVSMATHIVNPCRYPLLARGKGGGLVYQI